MHLPPRRRRSLPGLPRFRARGRIGDGGRRARGRLAGLFGPALNAIKKGHAFLVRPAPVRSSCTLPVGWCVTLRMVQRSCRSATGLSWRQV